ncbi:response regulator receiver domain protein, partial [Streptomyces ipomoeae 91-03]
MAGTSTTRNGRVR